MASKTDLQKLWAAYAEACERGGDEEMIKTGKAYRKAAGIPAILDLAIGTAGLIQPLAEDEDESGIFCLEDEDE